MLPTITIFGKDMATYGLVGILGFLLALLYVFIKSPKFGLNRFFSVCVGTLGAVAALVGGKILYVIVNFQDLIELAGGENPVKNIALFIASSGIVMYGGLLGGFAGCFLATKIYRLDYRKHLRVLVPGMLIFHGIGRIGCFLTGCCHGKETDSIIGITYAISQLAPNGVKLIPVQLIESAGVFVIFIIVNAYVTSKKEIISPFFLYIMMYCPFRFALEFFRGDEVRGIWGPLSTSQIISIVLVIMAVVWKILFDKRRRHE